MVETIVERDRRTSDVIAAAIEVHRHLGPGLLESTYEECLVHELGRKGVEVERQKWLPIRYKELTIEDSFRIDLLVGRAVVVEVKAVAGLAAVHEAQLLTYLRLSGCRTGLLLNFNVSRMADGIKRLVL